MSALPFLADSLFWGMDGTSSLDWHMTGLYRPAGAGLWDGFGGLSSVDGSRMIP